MKRLALTLGFLLYATVASAQVPAIPGVDSLRWEHSEANLMAAAVVRFDVCYDTVTPCTAITPTAARFTPTTLQGGPPATGNGAFKILLPALTMGTHEVVIKACNTTVCGPATSAFSFTVTVIPAAPTGLRLIGG